MNFKPVLLEFTHVIWNSLMADLAKAGRGERESGAFLLGTHTKGRRQVHAWLPYGDVDPPSLNYGIIRLRPDAFPRVWGRCSELGMEVVADIHTHPHGPQQSSSDRTYPMISIPGHLALIAPRFATHKVTTQDVSLNRYLGGGRWESFLGDSAAARIQLVTTYES
jgi:proteasome lid subunit RPN8/RPN11